MTNFSYRALVEMQIAPMELITSIGRVEDFEVGFFFGSEGPGAFATRALLIDVENPFPCYLSGRESLVASSSTNFV